MVKYDDEFLGRFLGEEPLYSHDVLKDAFFLENHNLAGESLKEVLSSGIKEDMNKVILVLSKRTSTTRPSNTRGASRVVEPVSTDRATYSSDKVVEVEAGVVETDMTDRGGKMTRVDGEEESSRRVILKRCGDPPQFGVGKSLTFTGVNKETLPPVFNAFDQPQDMGSYIDRSRDEIVDRCFIRGGRFLANISHIVKDYKSDVDRQWREGSIRELAEAKEAVQAAQRRAADIEDREKKLASEMETLKKDYKELRRKLRAKEDELVQVRSVMELEKKKSTSLEVDVASLRNERDVLTKEVSVLKLEAEKVAEEMANAMGSGYQGCYDRLAKAGLDLTGHSLDDYCADLAKGLEEKQDGDDGNAV